MNSGVLTSKEHFTLEERTSFFINYAGVCAQEALLSFDTGIANSKLYKILANVICDWHWLSKNDSSKYKFTGIGELRWIPNRTGGNGAVESHLSHDGIKPHYGLISDIPKLIAYAGEYGKYDAKPLYDSPRIIFPSYLPFSKMEKAPVGRLEQHYWKILTQTYSLLDDESLDALASCRTKTTTANVLWTQFVLWKRFMGIVLDKLWQEDASSLNDAEKKMLKGYFSYAKECVRYLNKVVRYRMNIETTIKKVIHISQNNELSSIIPCLDIREGDLLPRSYDTFISLIPIIDALQIICNGFMMHNELEEAERKVSFETIETKLDYIHGQLLLERDKLDSQKWNALFLRPGSNQEIAQRILALIEKTFVKFEDQLGLQILRRTIHYKNFLDVYYPLPRDHFLRGN